MVSASAPLRPDDDAASPVSTTPPSADAATASKRSTSHTLTVWSHDAVASSDASRKNDAPETHSRCALCVAAGARTPTCASSPGAPPAGRLDDARETPLGGAAHRKSIPAKSPETTRPGGPDDVDDERIAIASTEALCPRPRATSGASGASTRESLTTASCPDEATRSPPTATALTGPSCAGAPLSVPSYAPATTRFLGPPRRPAHATAPIHSSHEISGPA
mmetsp:Transcript_4763/g.19421  ORF Transcript_4763/g.19421 Transcript_4763/m.19421 type:complete len:221 (+) Transcript_4763:73-735(+)